MYTYFSSCVPITTQMKLLMIIISTDKSLPDFTVQMQLEEYGPVESGST